MLIRTAVLVAIAILLAVLCTTTATAQLYNSSPSDSGDRPYLDGPMLPKVLQPDGVPTYPGVPTYNPGVPTIPGVPTYNPGVPANPGGTGPGPNAGGNALQPLGCIIADRIENCLVKFGPQNAIGCNGCDPNNITCPSGKSYALPNTKISMASWGKNRAVSIKQSAIGYKTETARAVSCGKVGKCTITCRTELIDGVIFNSCPKVGIESDIAIFYYDLSGACQPQIVGAAH